jgi:hypothetical protein
MMATAYCMQGRTKVDIKDTKSVTLINAGISSIGMSRLLVSAIALKSSKQL